MSTYASDHASAYADVAAAGTAITFSREVPGTYSAAADTFTAASTATVAGVAIEKRGDPRVYAALNLTQQDARRLLFCPATYGAEPALGATCTWDGASYTVRSVSTVSPNGTTILADVVVAR